MASGGGKATSSSRAAAMSVGAGTVEALIKERHAGLCRLNGHALQQRTGSTNAAARNGACTNGKVPLAAGGAAARRRKARQEQQEEELRTVMYLSNWGPNN